MAGTGLTGKHPTIANLWVREIDPTNNDLILTGLVKTDTPGSNSKFVETYTYSHGCLLVKNYGLSGSPLNFGILPVVADEHVPVLDIPFLPSLPGIRLEQVLT